MLLFLKGPRFFIQLILIQFLLALRLSLGCGQLLHAHAELDSAHADVDSPGHDAADELRHGLFADFIGLLLHRHGDAVGLRFHDLTVFLALFGAHFRNEGIDARHRGGHAHPGAECSGRTFRRGERRQIVADLRGGLLKGKPRIHRNL